MVVIQVPTAQNATMKMKKMFHDGCCYPRREDDETPVCNECNCTTYYCRECARYIGTEIPNVIPSCIGYPTEDQYENHTGWSNQKLFEELGLDYQLALSQTTGN